MQAFDDHFIWSVLAIIFLSNHPLNRWREQVFQNYFFLVDTCLLYYQEPENFIRRESKRIEHLYIYIIISTIIYELHQFFE